MNKYTSALQYRELLVDLIGSLKTKRRIVGVEIGVWQGYCSRFLLETFPNLKLSMVDAWELGVGTDPTQPRKQWNGIQVKSRQKAVRSTRFARRRRHIIKEFSSKASHMFEDNSLDFAFVDANHQYSYVKEDLELWFPKVRDGGLFCGHDYDGKWDRKGKWGVKKAVDEFGLERGYNIQNQIEVWWFIK